MWKSVIYKEWLKIRWFQIGLTVLGIITVGNVFLKVQHDILFRDANNYWYSLLFQGLPYYGGLLKYVPLTIGLGIGIAQFIPEIMSKRIKLTFHLPINENKVLLMMLGFGFLCVLLAYVIMYSLFLGLSHHFFAYEIVELANASVIPWFLAGFAAYFLVALIVLEPIMKYRGFYLVVTYFFISLFLEYNIPGGFAPINWKLGVLTALSSITLLFSAYRFRKGEM